MKIELITSRDNQRLVNARKVRDGRVPGKIFIEGRRLVEEALRSDIAIEECFFSDDFNDNGLREAFHCPAFQVPVKIFHSIADTDQPQGVIVIAARPETSPSESLRLSTAPVVVFLSEISNPSNLGAVIRTAEAAGVAGVIISDNSADVFSTKALRAAMGSSFRVPIWDGVNFDEALKWAKDEGRITTAADTSGNEPYTAIDWTERRLLIFGSEAHGLNEAALEKVDEKITIPMENSIESLNLAVSAGIILFEARRQGER
jgi:TrmH family RNA methyltransferase